MYVTLDFDGPPARPVIALPEAASLTLSEGRHLFFEGDPAAKLYKVVSGVLRLSRVLIDGRRQIIAFGYPGDIVGFTPGTTHHADCDALVAAELIAIPQSVLRDGCRSSHPLRDEVVAAALEEIGGMQDHFMMLGLKSAREKVASFLGTVARRTGTRFPGRLEITLPMARSDIAAFLGLSIETVSRQITALKKESIIDTQGERKIVVLDEPALSEVAGDA